MIVSKIYRITEIVTMIAIMIVNKIIIRIFIKIKTIYYFSFIFLILLNHFYISLFYLFNNIDLFSIRVISCMLIISSFKTIAEILLYYFCCL